ncbi:MAG: F0F1 ATP synthase subunit A [Sedimentisphaerales bacterium]|nr:F0F1 ATP synthase subunit A [Sedimentisphaerales bacterium]
MINIFNGILASTNPLDHIVEHAIRIGTHEVPFLTNHKLMILVVAVLMIVIFCLASRQRSMVPTGLRNVVETVCCFIREDIARPALGEDTDRFVKYLWTTFFFILFCNLVGMIPTGGILYLISGGYLVNMGGTATSNIWVTGALAVTAFFMIHISGIAKQGIVLYVKNFIPNVPWPLMLPMYILELLAAFVKPFALAIRLFANMLAGHAVLGALVGLILMFQSYTVGGVTVLMCALLSLLELFVAFLQAYVFTFLVALFIGAAIHPEH